MVYQLMRRVIERGGYDRLAVRVKISAFRDKGLLSAAEYTSLLALMGGDGNA